VHNNIIEIAVLQKCFSKRCPADLGAAEINLHELGLIEVCLAEVAKG
jgi:hypothetical protein